MLGMKRPMECRRQCARTDHCTHWTWRERRCLLLRHLNSDGLPHEETRGSFAGALTDACLKTIKLTLAQRRRVAKRDVCVEYGVAYDGGDDLRLVGEQQQQQQQQQ